MNSLLGKFGKLILPVFFFFIATSSGQIIAPPKWTVTLSPNEPEIGQKATLILEATIPVGWYIYSNDFKPDLGPILTSLNLEQSDAYEKAGSLKAINPKKKFEEIWEGEVTYFMGKGRFEQPISLNSKNGIIVGAITYQMCSDLTGQCINYEEDLALPFSAIPRKEGPSSSGEAGQQKILEHLALHQKKLNK